MNPNLAEDTHALLLELKRLRSEGVREIYIEEDSIRGLEDAFPSSTPIAQPIEAKKDEIPNLSSSVSVTPTPGNKQEEPEPVVTFAEPANPSGSLPEPPVLELPEGTKTEQWNWLKDQVLSCETCTSQLNPNSKVVFGSGSLDTDLFLCGEAPGAEEELKGMPFVGPAGELLVRIIEAMGMDRASVYLGNILNWRPQHNQAYGNRPPTQEEMSFCLPYLRSQIEIVRPQVLVALGKTATDGLLGHDPKRRLSDCRGKWFEFEGIPLMVTYHPSYLLHNPSKSSKRKVWEDMLMVMEKIELPISEKQRGFFL